MGRGWLCKGPRRASVAMAAAAAAAWKAEACMCSNCSCPPWEWPSSMGPGWKEGLMPTGKCPWAWGHEGCRGDMADAGWLVAV